MKWKGVPIIYWAAPFFHKMILRASDIAQNLRSENRLGGVGGEARWNGVLSLLITNHLLVGWWWTYYTQVKGDRLWHFGWHTSAPQILTNILESTFIFLCNFWRLWKLQRLHEKGVCSCVQASGLCGSHVGESCCCVASLVSENCARPRPNFVQCSEAAEQHSPKLLQGQKLAAVSS